MLEKRRGIQQLLTISEVALLLNIHIDTIMRWSDNGVLRSYCPSTHNDVMFDYDDVKKMLLERGISS